jgi:uncharacterized protein YqhQ
LENKNNNSKENMENKNLKKEQWKFALTKGLRFGFLFAILMAIMDYFIFNTEDEVKKIVVRNLILLLVMSILYTALGYFEFKKKNNLDKFQSHK